MRSWPPRAAVAGANQAQACERSSADNRPMTPMRQSTSEHVADVLAQIQRLEAKRAALVEQKSRAQAEELKVLADAYARKLQAAGLSIRAGIAALRPYEKAIRPRANAPGGPASAQGEAKRPLDQLQEQARQVFGDDAGAWLARPHPLLGGMSPRDAANHLEGLEKIQALLTA